MHRLQPRRVLGEWLFLLVTTMFQTHAQKWEVNIPRINFSAYYIILTYLFYFVKIIFSTLALPKTRRVEAVEMRLLQREDSNLRDSVMSRSWDLSSYAAIRYIPKRVNGRTYLYTVIRSQITNGIYFELLVESPHTASRLFNSCGHQAFTKGRPIPHIHTAEPNLLYRRLIWLLT